MDCAIEYHPFAMSLPYFTQDIPGIGGSIKNRAEDFFVQELPLHTRNGEVQRRPIVSCRRLRHVHPAARRVHFDLHFRLTVIVGEYDLRVMRAPHQLGYLFDQVRGVRAQVIVDLSVTGGNGDAHEGQPPCSAIIC